MATPIELAKHLEQLVILNQKRIAQRVEEGPALEEIEYIRTSLGRAALMAVGALEGQTDFSGWTVSGDFVEKREETPLTAITDIAAAEARGLRRGFEAALGGLISVERVDDFLRERDVIAARLGGKLLEKAGSIVLER